jgi:hypothetical protein
MIQKKKKKIHSIKLPPLKLLKIWRWRHSPSSSSLNAPLGAGDIEKYLWSEKHKLSDHASALTSSMLNFFKKMDLPSSKDFEVAAAEATWAYYTVQENHSFRLNDCASRLIQT